ncbi:MAG: hypothetical protein CMJ83_20915 [Planctomycetes bacterium]|nr:hypothetical protein [Planctomycetota bacterium]
MPTWLRLGIGLSLGTTFMPQEQRLWRLEGDTLFARSDHASRRRFIDAPLGRRHLPARKSAERSSPMVQVHLGRDGGSRGGRMRNYGKNRKTDLLQPSR